MLGCSAQRLRPGGCGAYGHRLSAGHQRNRVAGGCEAPTTLDSRTARDSNTSNTSLRLTEAAAVCRLAGSGSRRRGFGWQRSRPEGACEPLQWTRAGGDQRLIPGALGFAELRELLAHPADHASDVITAQLPHTLTPAAIPPHQPERSKLVRRVRACNQRARLEHAEDAGDRPGGGVVQRCQLAGSRTGAPPGCRGPGGTPRRRVRASSPGMGG